MLRLLPYPGLQRQSARLAGITIFTLATIVAARLVIPMEPVPFTLQPLAVLLAGMVLGARDGALSQLAYVALIAIGLPFDANMRGQAALFGPTGGYLIGFIAAAFVTGLLVERAGGRLWQRWLAGAAGIAVIYAFGVPVLALTRGLTLETAFAAGAAPFLAPDLVKALLAAALTEGSRALLLRGKG
ncbi:MAG TPA: biotin transporter BioY [Candidatus Limnocylindrales bacterium]|nr:biotin transporter BioY [Candidatus Limnocylindrales bacterium]